MLAIDLSVKPHHYRRVARSVGFAAGKIAKQGRGVIETTLKRKPFVIHWPKLRFSIYGAETKLERWLAAESAQLPVLIPAGLAIGIVFWERFGDTAFWPMLVCCVSMLLIASAGAKDTQWTSILRFAAICFLTGFLCITLKSAIVAAPPLQDIQITTFYARILRVENIQARQKVRFLLNTARHAGLPEKVRVNLTPEQFRPEFTSGSIIKLRARLVPPAGPSLPGGYDFARRAWFAQIGATGTALGPVLLYRKSDSRDGLQSARSWIEDQVSSALPRDKAALAIALATGEQGQIAESDAEAMRNSGLAHLLSISGLHVTAVVGAIFLVISRMLAFFPYFALRQPVPIYAACAAAIGAIAYTLLTGAEVPTVRSCIAALMILAALALGRNALSLRLVAFGAVIILLFWPEALAGPSFQLSFAAVATIIILHDSGWMRALAARNANGGIPRRVAGGVFNLLITGLAIEVVLAPIALFHFHKTGLYGALANIIAIPLTTFVIMPFEALGLLFGTIELGGPFWWVAGAGIEAILWIAHYASSLPGAVAMFPAMPHWAFGFIIMGVFWCGIFKTAFRWAGIPVAIVGVLGMIAAPHPDILVTGDGKHLAVTDAGNSYTILRDKAGEYMRDTLRENAGINADPVPIGDWPGADCSPDTCVISLKSDGRDWTLLAVRTRYAVPAMELAAACSRVDIVVSDRWLPRSCKPRWIKADRAFLQQAGGLAIYLAKGRVAAVSQQSPSSPWVHAAAKAKISAQDKRRRAAEGNKHLVSSQNQAGIAAAKNTSER
jgi:competence protein ComEC